MKVIAAAGLRVPREDNPRTYITESEVLDVPLSLYYRRRLASGELVEVTDVPAGSAAEASTADTGGAADSSTQDADAAAGDATTKPATRSRK